MIATQRVTNRIVLGVAFYVIYMAETATGQLLNNLIVTTSTLRIVVHCHRSLSVFVDRREELRAKSR